MPNNCERLMYKLFKESLRNDNIIARLIDASQNVAGVDSYFPDKEHENDMYNHEAEAESLRKRYIASTYLYMKLVYRAFRKGNLSVWQSNMLDLAKIVGDKNIKEQIRENPINQITHDKLLF